jgi:hypothetical protein
MGRNCLQRVEKDATSPISADLLALGVHFCKDRVREANVLHSVTKAPCDLEVLRRAVAFLPTVDDDANAVVETLAARLATNRAIDPAGSDYRRWEENRIVVDALGNMGRAAIPAAPEIIALLSAESPWGAWGWPMPIVDTLRMIGLEDDATLMQIERWQRFHAHGRAGGFQQFEGTGERSSDEEALLRRLSAQETAVRLGGSHGTP